MWRGVEERLGRVWVLGRGGAGGECPSGPALASRYPPQPGPCRPWRARPVVRAKPPRHAAVGPIEGPWGVSLGIRPPHPPSSPPQVKAIIADLLSDDCRLLLAVRTTYRKLGAGLDPTHLVAWTEVLTHWATAMRAGYTLRATPEDRATFREHATWYVMKKSRVRNGITIWYDWQMY